MIPLVFVALMIGREPALPDTSRCVAAVRFLREVQHLIAVVEPDTIDDWRTGRHLPGCRVTAAGTSDVGVAREAVRFYERLRAAGWKRTPDPRDAPNESSLRFRWESADCLFNVYDGARLGTDAEFTVNDAVVPKLGQVRYQVFTMCVERLPAA